MEIFNSYTQKLEEFKPINKGKVNMYVCGPTTYNYIHIGNARPVIFFDVVYKYFKYLKFNVQYVSNITDINDKIYKQSLHENCTEKEISIKYTLAYLNDLIDLNCDMPTHLPKVSAYLGVIDDYIQNLINLGYVYKSNRDYFFKVENVKEYGQLSKQNIDNLIAGARLNVNENKQNPLDFVVWKSEGEGEQFLSSLGLGRPGWHTECSAMIANLFTGCIDIHGGGSDLKFPHHENEIAQSRALYNHTLAKYWMHNGRVEVNYKKMSKSTGNMIFVKDLLKQYDASAYRLLVLAHQYRKPIDFSTQLMQQYQDKYIDIKKAIIKAYLNLPNECSEGLLESYVNRLHKNLANDFATPLVVADLFQMIKELNSTIAQKQLLHMAQLYNTIKIYMNCLGVNVNLKLAQQHKDMYKSWQEAREKKNYKEADELRVKLMKYGVLQ